jgi:zinc transport system substrate-binding protein
MKKTSIKLLWTTALLLFAHQSVAMNVVTSVKPIHLITQEITAGVADSSYIISAGASPHDYALRPSDIKRIKRADLVIWFGDDLEPFLEKVLEDKTNVLTLSQLSSIDFRSYQTGHDEEGHDHHGHDHHGLDPHFWLGPYQVKAVAKEITDKLIQLDPLHRSEYQSNLSRFQVSVDNAIEQITADLTAIQGHGYFVFHDAYGYFEETFGLNNLGHFTVSPDRKPGAKTLIGIRNKLKADNVYCVFSEPQFNPSVIESVTRGTDVGRGKLDPLATEVEEKPGAYAEFISGLGREFERCLTK